MKRFLALFLFFSLIVFSRLTFAEGFYVDPQSVEGMGLAQAGAAVGYEDGSAGFYNPAALATYEKPVVSMQLHAFKPSARFSDQGSSVSGSPNTGTNITDGGRDAALPVMYLAAPISKRISASVYINSPFGLGTQYPKDWVGRYQALESSMKLVNLGTAAAIDLGSGFSIGSGLSAIYADAILSTAIDFGSIGQAAFGAERASALGLKPQMNDGLVEVKASDWAMGWNSGALYRYGQKDRNRIGISYRGRSDLHFHNGSAEFQIPDSAKILTSTGQFMNTGARSSLSLPGSATFGSKTHLSDNWILLQQSTWTEWSKIQNLTVEFDNPLQPSSAVPQNWNDTWFHSVGLAHKPVERVVLRAGVGYENAIVPNGTRRYPRLPTSDSVWASAGIGVDFPETKAKLDLSFTRVDYRGGREDSIGATGDRLRGNWSVATNAVGTALTFYW
jgi:long-chain fatty acid transport protein